MYKRSNRKIRAISLIVALAMVLGLLPGIEFATAAEAVSYIDRSWDGEKIVETEKECTDYTVINGDTTTLENGGWYVVSGNVANDHRITVDGTANIILCDGATLTSNGGILASLSDTLNIYAQRLETGKLNATTSNRYAAIGGNSYGSGGDINIFGGNITAEGSTDAAAIGGGYAGDGAWLTVYGGTVNAIGGYSDGAGIGGGSRGDGRNTTIYGGTVTAISGGEGRAIGAGYGGAKDGNLTVAAHATVKAGDAAPGADTTLDDYLAKGYKYIRISAPYVNYIERSLDGERVVETQKSCTKFTLVDEDTDVFSDGEWYVVKSNINSEHRINASGTVNLILCDGYALTLNSGILAPIGCTLNIYGQDADSGKLTAYGVGYNAGIGSARNSAGGTVNVHGGTVTAIGGSLAAGIGGGDNSDGGNLNVYGGSVTAGGGEYSAAIGGGDGGNGGNVAVYGGTLVAASSHKSIGAGADGDNDGNITATSKAVIKAGDTAPNTATTLEAFRQNRSHYVSITVSEPVKYIERSWDGEKVVETEKECTDYTTITSSTSSIFLEDGGWYVVKGAVEIGASIRLNGATANLILTDGCTLTLETISVPSGKELTVYGQSEGSGVLAAKGRFGMATIGGGASQPAGKVTFHGGTVNAKGTDRCAAIGGNQYCDGGDVVVYGGTVNATSGSHGAGIGGGYQGAGGSLTVYGGTVGATAGNYGAGIGGGSLGNGANVAVYGGTVDATGGMNAAGIGGGSKGNGGNVAIYGGNVTATGVTGIGAGLDGTDHGTLTLAPNAVIKAGDAAPGTEVTASDYIQNRNKYVNITVPSGPIYVPYIMRGWSNGEVTSAEGVCEVDEVINENTTTLEGGKWYAVMSNVTVADNIEVKGTANLILCDDCTLTMAKYTHIELKEGNTLNIYGQANDSGALVITKADEYYPGIGSDRTTAGTVNVYGGTVTAVGGARSAGIGGGCWRSGGNVTVYGGTVTAKGLITAAGIGGGEQGNGGNVTVYGGTVNAYGGFYTWDSTQEFAAGIGSGDGVNVSSGNAMNGGTVYIYGGTVNATGGKHATGIGGGRYCHGANVYIYGGDVTATGGDGAASFGAGYGVANDGSLTLGDTMVLKVGQETPDTKMTPEEYYPIGHRYAHVYEDVIAKGQNWFINGDGVLYITGEVQNNSTTVDNTQWLDYKSQITAVVAKEGAKVTNCDRLFSNCKNMKSADIANLDITGTTSMRYMFSGCYAIENLDLSTLDTSAVTNMQCMFYNASGLKSVNLDGFVTDNVTDMQFMFRNCQALTALDLSDFNTAKVTTVNTMFSGCTNLAKLDISGFSSEKLSNAGGVLDACTALEEIAVNGNALQKLASPISTLSSAWYNKDTGAKYESEEQLREIEGKAVLTKTQPMTYVARIWSKGKIVETVKTVDDYIVVDEDTWRLSDGGWYVVTGNVTCNTITVSKDANLILCDGSSLTVNGGIKLTKGNTLNIYGQAHDSGVLTANGAEGAAGIGGVEKSTGGALNVYGGTVNANGGHSGAGIGGGANTTSGPGYGSSGIVTIYGGTVNAIGGGNGAGIGGGVNGGNGGVSIYGGTVTAIGGDKAAGIGGGNDGYCGLVHVYNGNVTAIGGEFARAIGKGYGGGYSVGTTVEDALSIKGGADAASAVNLTTVGDEEYINIYLCDHAWNDGEITRAPTYTAEGEKTCTCTKCGKTKTEAVPKLVKLFDLSLTPGKVAADTTPDKYQITWDLNVVYNTEINPGDYDFNVFEYGIKYAANEQDLTDYMGGTTPIGTVVTREYATSSTGLSFVYKTTRYHLHKVAENRKRYAIGYVRYECDGTSYETYTVIDCATTYYGGLIGGTGDPKDLDDGLQD